MCFPQILALLREGAELSHSIGPMDRNKATNVEVCSGNFSLEVTADCPPVMRLSLFFAPLLLVVGFVAESARSRLICPIRKYSRVNLNLNV